MLYPKNSTPFSIEQFENPGSEYRATPFWAWNNKPESEELCWQIEQLKKLGYGGFHMHVRTGFAAKYLGDEHMQAVRDCIEKARSEKMLAWLYDEDRWPSGAAGGYVTKNPKYRACHLLLTRHPYGSNTNFEVEQHSKATSNRTENGELLTCFDVVLTPDGNLQNYCTISPNDSAKGIKLYAYVETALPNPWFNNQTYVNTLDPEAISEFIKITYDRYNDLFQKDFGGVVPAMFTDEPQFTEKTTLSFAQEDKDVTLPWTQNLPATFTECYGDDIVASLPELLWDLPNAEISRLRYCYHDHIAERFAAAFADQCGEWCNNHGLLLTGHMMEEPTLESQTHALGEAMRSYRSFGLPGIDMLCDRREFTTAKQAQSATRQYGYPGVMSELYGVTNWDFDFRGHKLQGDWQAALGVTVRVPHLSWVSMNGEAKRDYPSTFNYQSPWYEQYPYVEDHFARINTALTRGKAICKIGVIHPIESYWLHWGTQQNTALIRGQMDKKFTDLSDWLLRGLIDFDYICESTLPELCDPQLITGDGLNVGEMCYDVVLVPDVETLRTTTLTRLEAFCNAGGRLIFMGDYPKYLDGYRNDGPLKLYERSQKIAFDRLELLHTLKAVKDLDIRDKTGAQTDKFIYQYRQDDDARWLFIARANKDIMPDISTEDKLTIAIAGEWKITLFNTLNGSNELLPVSYNDGQTVFTRSMYNHDSLLIKLTSPDGEVPVLDANLSNTVAEKHLFKGEVPITLHEPNVLLIDNFYYALNDDKWEEAEEVLRLDNILRGRLGWPARKEAFAQPWVENDTSTLHTLNLKYLFESDVKVIGAMLALENAAISTVTLNGEAATLTNEYYVDKCIGCVALPEIKSGQNELLISVPYGKKIDIEACYLIGDFGVVVSGAQAKVTAAVKTLCFGDITSQGLPFYGGNITYHLKARTTNNKLSVKASCYRGHLLRVAVDGTDCGVIAYAPYTLELDNLADGEHTVDITYFGSRINTFGQLHCIDKTGYWWGPNSWRTEGEDWTYGYNFWIQGILKSPELMV